MALWNARIGERSIGEYNNIAQNLRRHIIICIDLIDAYFPNNSLLKIILRLFVGELIKFANY